MSDPAAAPFVDTNVLVRYLTNDSPELAERAAAIVEGSEELLLSEVVLVEAAYVLTSVYGVSRAQVVDALMALVQRRNLRLLTVAKPIALRALELCRGSGRVSFADAVLWAQARSAGAAAVYSFDEQFPEEAIEVLG